MADIRGAFKLPFHEQVDFFRRKLNLPSERYDDIARAAHDRCFIVAGATRADLLADLRRAVDRAVADGATLQDFRKDFRALVAKHGWTGWTGEGTKAGEAWRTKVIWQTNLRASHAAGRHAQLTAPEVKKALPWWRYVHNDTVMTPRPEHKHWGDAHLTLPADHPFWQTHFPPNGWGCRCRVVGVAAPRAGDATQPPEGWDEPDPKTGLPPGIDPGWDYAPGANTNTALRRLVRDKLITYPPAIQRALVKDIGKKLNATDRVGDYVAAVMSGKSGTDDLWLGFIEHPERFAETVKTDLADFIVLLPPDAVRHEAKRHGHDGGDQRPIRAADYAKLIDGLDRGVLKPSRETRKDGRDAERFVVEWEEAGEKFRAVFGVRPGRHNRAVALVSLIVKTAGNK
ncbi:MAG: head morphogenesis protein [Candidatus Accumulibacter sp.]|nr:head morphogenesis protein [Accumulibacter sp.]